MERAGALYFELADAIKQASENILADKSDPGPGQADAEGSVSGKGGPTLGEMLEALEMKQYLLPLKKSGATVERLVAEARAGGAAGAEAGESAVRHALKAAGVKKIGHREKIVQAVLARAAAADPDGN